MKVFFAPPQRGVGPGQTGFLVPALPGRGMCNADQIPTVPTIFPLHRQNRNGPGPGSWAGCCTRMTPPQRPAPRTARHAIIMLIPPC